MRYFKFSLHSGRLLFFLGLAITIAQCSEQKSISDSATDSRSDSSLEASPIPVDPRWNQVARYIAGRGAENESSLRKLTESAAYRNYQQRVRHAWDRYENHHLKVMEKWQTSLDRSACGKELFYPFSGPDITHAITLFPDASSYTMIGLEKVGPMPEVDPARGDREVRKLDAVWNAGGDVLGRNFFKTIDMAKEVGNNSLSGVSGLLLFFLGNMNEEILAGGLIAIQDDGTLLPLEEAQKQGHKGGADGVTYRIRNHAGKIRQVTYLSVNLMDEALGEKVGNFLKRQKNFDTMLKAASFLMFRPSFDDIRSTILSGSHCILTDSSGFPFHYLKQDQWDINLFGKYVKPIPLFAMRFDRDLRDAMQSSHPGELPFSYGYNMKIGESHIVFARRKAAFAITAPQFDGSGKVGDDTFSKGSKTIVVHKKPEAKKNALQK